MYPQEAICPQGAICPQETVAFIKHEQADWALSFFIDFMILLNY